MVDLFSYFYFWDSLKFECSVGCRPSLSNSTWCADPFNREDADIFPKDVRKGGWGWSPSLELDILQILYYLRKGDACSFVDL